jgi:hypothetical protein
MTKKTLTLGGARKREKGELLTRKGKILYIPKKEQEESSAGVATNRKGSAPRHRSATKKIESKNRHKLAFRKMEKCFPKVFNLSNPRPLEKGIREELLKMDNEVSNKTIRLGLFFYCNSHQYLKSVKEGVQKVNAKGRFTKKVTKDEEESAKERLKELYRSIKSKK